MDQSFTSSDSMKKAEDPSWPLPDWTTLLLGSTEILMSFIFFRVLSAISANWVKKKSTSAFLPSEKLRWKWKNIFVSFIHANITGICCLVCFYQTPKLAEDVISIYTTFSYSVVAFAAGYFIHDTIDMIGTPRSRQCIELIAHHFVLLIALSVPILTYKSVGYLLVGLLVEINSIFLHLRQLLLLHKFDKTSSTYRLNSILNLGTFIIFRISPLCWMTRWIVINKNLVPFFFYFLSSLGLAITTVMNIVLFYRCLSSDFIHRKDTSSKLEWLPCQWLFTCCTKYTCDYLPYF